MTTARTIITKALRKLHVLGQGQSLTADEAQEALLDLDNMIEQWSLEGGFIYTKTIETFNLTGATSYTIGAGGDFNTTQPLIIEAMVLNDEEVDTSLSQLSTEQYASIEQKNTGEYPASFYYDNNHPLGRIYFYPVAGAQYTVTMYAQKKLEGFTDIGTDYNLPTGYANALIDNLVIKLASQYGKEPAESIKTGALEAKNAIYKYNTRNDTPLMGIDSALLDGSFGNIYKGYNS